MNILTGFGPTSATVNVVGAAASASVALPSLPTGSFTLRVANIGTAVSFIELGGSAVAAALATSMPMAPNSVVYLELSSAMTYLAAIGPGAGSVIYATVGVGGIYG